MSESELSRQTDSFDFDTTRRYVRICKERAGGFIEFDFAVGEPEIFVELILPRDAFVEFCEMNKVEMLPTESTDNSVPSEWDWRLRDATKTLFK